MVTAGAFFMKGDLGYRQKLSLIRDYMDYTYRKADVRIRNRKGYKTY